tara:strand:- start:297 stop:983 length:687 start_codon:yes stop_codon:yes gene_type:complete
MSLVSELYIFLKNPKELNTKGKKNITLIKEFIVYDLVITILWAFLTAICTLLLDDFDSVFKSKKTIDDNTIYSFLVISIISPILEELAFRFSLRISRLTISVSLAVQLIFYLHLFKFIHVNFNYRIILMIIAAIVFYFTISKRLSVYFKQKINFYIYFNLLVFTLLHVLNFSYFEVHQYLYIPILVSLQFFFGLYLTYVRLKYNFLYVIGFHIFHNSLIVYLGFLMKP